MLPRGRLPFSPITDRRPLALPDDARHRGHYKVRRLPAEGLVGPRTGARARHGSTILDWYKGQSDVSSKADG